MYADECLGERDKRVMAAVERRATTTERSQGLPLEVTSSPVFRLAVERLHHLQDRTKIA